MYKQYAIASSFVLLMIFGMMYLYLVDTRTSGNELMGFTVFDSKVIVNNIPNYLIFGLVALIIVNTMIIYILKKFDDG